MLSLGMRFKNIFQQASGNWYHAEKSSFNLIAKNVQPEKEEAIEAVNTFRSSWHAATFRIDQGGEEK